jgi:hypothetical protein
MKVNHNIVYNLDLFLDFLEIDSCYLCRRVLFCFCTGLNVDLRW